MDESLERNAGTGPEGRGDAHDAERGNIRTLSYDALGYRKTKISAQKDGRVYAPCERYGTALHESDDFGRHVQFRTGAPTGAQVTRTTFG